MNLAKDFDRGCKAGIVKKKDGRQLLRTGVALLAGASTSLTPSPVIATVWPRACKAVTIRPPAH